MCPDPPCPPCPAGRTWLVSACKVDSMEEENAALLKFHQQIICRHPSSHGEQSYHISWHPKHRSSVTRGTLSWQCPWHELWKRPGRQCWGCPALWHRQSSWNPIPAPRSPKAVSKDTVCCYDEHLLMQTASSVYGTALQDDDNTPLCAAWRGLIWLLVKQRTVPLKSKTEGIIDDITIPAIPIPKEKLFLLIH